MFNKLSFILLRDFGYRYKLYTRNYWNILCSHFMKYAHEKNVLLIFHKELKRLFVFEIFNNKFFEHVIHFLGEF